MKIVIIGAGKVGRTLSEHLSAEGHDVIAVDNDPAPLNNSLNNLDIMCIQGNGATYEAQKEAGVDKADLVIATTPTDEVNMLCCLLAKKLGAGRCIARVRNPEYFLQLEYVKEELGLSMAVNPELAAAMEMARIFILPAATQAELFANGRVELLEYKITQDTPIANTSLADIYHKYRLNVLICAVQRGDQVFIPDGSFVLRPGDKINLTSNHEEAERFFKKAGVLNEKIKSVMIVGGGRIGYYLAKQLVALHMDVKIIESDYKRCVTLSELLSDVSVIHADGTDHVALKEEGIERVDAFAALTGIDEENMIMAMYAKTKQVYKVVAKINRGSYVNIADYIGLDSIVSPKLLAADNIISYVRAMKNSEGSNNVETLCRVVNDRVEALEFIVRENAPYLDIPLKDLKTKKDVLLACIVRRRKTIIPRGTDCIKLGDSVVVVTTIKNLHDLKEIFRG